MPDSTGKMKRETHKIKAKLPKRRKTWLINPRVRVHEQKGYRRSKIKRESEQAEK